METENKLKTLIIATLPFYLNDFNNILIKSESTWLALDYGLKILPLTYLLYLIKQDRITCEDIGLKSIKIDSLIWWTIGITILGLCLDEPGFALWGKVMPDIRLGSIPIGAESPFYMLDMTFGLALVAISEEIIFRGLAFNTLKERGFSTPAIFIISGIIFGTIHWSQGPVAITATAITGSGLMICMWKTRSIYPTIIAHYIINYLSFSGLAINSWGIQ